MTRLIQLSGVIMDHIYRVDAVPLPGQEAVVHGATLAPGGGFNAMVAARRMGMAVAYGGTLGTGPFASMIAAALLREGITTLRPPLGGQDQGCCTVLIDRQGERSFIASEGADGVVTPADLGIAPDPQDWLLLSGYALLYRGSRAALTGWLESGPPGKLVFDPGPQIAAIPQASRKAALAAAQWISANRAEAEVLTGLANPGAAAVALSDRAGGAVVRDGANGCYLAMAGQPARHIPGHAVLAVDTNGAGDAHIGAFIAALSRGDPPLRACALANIAAALSTTKEGPSTAPSLDRVLAELARAPHP